MSKALTVITPAPVATLAEIDEQAAQYMVSSKAENTLRAYRADWHDFTTWCAELRLAPLPAEPTTIARYLVARAPSCKVATLRRRLSAISKAHQAAGYPAISTRSDALRNLWEGICKQKGTAQKGKAPAVTDDIRAMVASLPPSLLGLRDRALLLMGFAGAFRRSELVGLDVEDVEFVPQGMTVTLRRSKTDQEGQGYRKGIPFGSRPDTCPVRAMRDWLDASGITTGALFHSVNRHGQLQDGRLCDRAVALVVKRCAEKVGLDPAQYAGHSLRAGLATAAAAAGAEERTIMAQTGHKSVNMVRRYIREGNLFRNNAAATVGL